MKYQGKTNCFLVVLILCLLALSCNKEEDISKPREDTIFYLPLIVHVLHNGEPIGKGSNLSNTRINHQITLLNNDFRRKIGTRGYNEHPDGGDSKIEFVLAKKDPNGKAIDGINRINMTLMEVEPIGYNQNHYAQYAYWNSNEYINVWLTPLPTELDCVVLGISSGPDTDLPGTEFLSIPKEGDAEGILINTVHFGESDLNCHANLGRTLTHEMGHYLGLLHTWGNGVCETNDFCEDTPAENSAVFGRNSFLGCDGEEIMISNYMNFSDDAVMNIFTNDQIKRMHYVLNNHEGRHALLSRSVIGE
ncbi:M43 family zinc metalloprotease [uncultured Croceitalea sp.]|uniref:M43 family zinc metalloprotease n=1 Tax=uncultured Croceitalea sp. TaxID=1798908 RepID=UPI003305DC86